jgi:hypothetical protein
MCTVLLPPGDNPIAVNKYININKLFFQSYREIKLIPEETFADIWEDNRLDIPSPFVRPAFSLGDVAVSLLYRYFGGY